MNSSNESGLAPATPVENSAMAHGADPVNPANAAYGAPDDFTPDPGLDPLAGATAGRKLSGGTIIIIAVILSAVAGLFSMHKLSKLTADVTLPSNVEKTVDDFFKRIEPADGTTPGQIAPAADKVLGVLTDTYSERQVPLRDVQRDPFIISEPEATAPTPGPDVTPLPDNNRKQREWERKREELRETMEADGAKIIVKSIMGGARPMALIGGQIVVVGDVVTAKNTSTEFTVEAISSGSIDLVATDEAFQLTVHVTALLQRD